MNGTQHVCACERMEQFTEFVWKKKKTGDVTECGSVETILADKQFYYKTTRAHPWAATLVGTLFQYKCIVINLTKTITAH